MNRSFVTLSVILLAAVTGCASKQPPPELVAARAAFARAQAGPASQANPAGLYEARKTLDAAERKQEDDPGSAEARNLAYIADRKVLRAEADGRAAIALQQERQAQAALEQMKANQLTAAQSAINGYKNQLLTDQQALDAERQARAKEAAARADAERRAKEALEKLNSFMSMKQETRGLVLTLSGSVLFEFDKSDLMPSAADRLQQVADALKEYDGRKITVVGHTDSVGTDAYNMDLSRRRAESVKNFLATHGVRPDLLASEGKGKTVPVATNATPEGRANNRRVEIVVEGTPGSESSSSSSTTTTTETTKIKQ